MVDFSSGLCNQWRKLDMPSVPCHICDDLYRITNISSDSVILAKTSHRESSGIVSEPITMIKKAETHEGVWPSFVPHCQSLMDNTIFS